VPGRVFGFQCPCGLWGLFYVPEGVEVLDDDITMAFNEGFSAREGCGVFSTQRKEIDRWTSPPSRFSARKGAGVFSTDPRFVTDIGQRWVSVPVRALGSFLPRPAPLPPISGYTEVGRCECFSAREGSGVFSIRAWPRGGCTTPSVSVPVRALGSFLFSCRYADCCDYFVRFQCP
jgi:hypothetical protein